MTFGIYATGAAILIAIGIHGVLTQPHLVRKVLALNVMGAGVFLFLIAVAFGDGQNPPDPVPQALVLTGIVVAVSVSGVALALVRRMNAIDGQGRLNEDTLE